MRFSLPPLSYLVGPFLRLIGLQFSLFARRGFVSSDWAGGSFATTSLEFGIRPPADVSESYALAKIPEILLLSFVRSEMKNTMNTPGFTADATLFAGTRHYQSSVVAPLYGMVQPAFQRDLGQFCLKFQWECDDGPCHWTTTVGRINSHGKCDDGSSDTPVEL